MNFWAAPYIQQNKLVCKYMLKAIKHLLWVIPGLHSLS